MQRRIATTVIGVSLLFTSHFALASAGSDVLATAGSATLTVAKFDQILAGMPPQLKMIMDSKPGMKEEMIRRWAEFSILAQEAEAQGIDQDSAIKQKLEDLRFRILVDEFVTRNTGKAEVGDADIQAYYDNNKEKYSHGEMVKAQHILIRVDENASTADLATALEKVKDIKAKIDKGQSFAILAQEFSDDPGSKINGGDLGFFKKGDMVPEFDKVAFSLKKGEISDPVKTAYGYHLIRVTDLKGPGTSPLAEVKDQIVPAVKEERKKTEVAEILVRLKKKYPIDIKK